MTQRQQSGSSSPKGRVFVLRTFHVDHATWARFGEVAQADGTSRSAQLRVLVDRYVAEADKRTAA